MNYEEKYLNIIKEIVLANIDKDKFNVFLFGSRARNDNDSRADVDVGIFGNESIGKACYKIVDQLEESIVSYKVDIVDFKSVDDGFKERALENIVMWNEAKNFKLSSKKINWGVIEKAKGILKNNDIDPIEYQNKMTDE